MPDDLGHSEPRRLPSEWVIQVCPGCNGLVGELTQTHLGDCEYRGKIFVPRTVNVRPDVRRGEAQNREAQAPLPASVSAEGQPTPRGLSNA